MSEKKKHILILMVGTSPAVITETVYALCKEKNDPPDEVFVYTTVTGKNKIIETLFNPKNNIWSQMLSELGKEGQITFGIPSIKEIIVSKNGITDYCDDIVTDNDNKSMADFLLREIRGLMDDQDNKISFSIAGGRKSMSAMGALIMSLVGRKCDKLYHILVEEGFENPKLEPPFFYPKKGDSYPAKNKESIDVKLSLMEIPVIHCRYWFHDKYKNISDYTTLVQTINQDQIEVKLDFKDHTIWYFDKQVKTNFFEFVLYYFFVYRHIENITYDADLDKENRLEEEIIPELEGFLEDENISVKDEKPSKGYSPKDFICKENLEVESLRKNISKLNDKLNKVNAVLKISHGKNNWLIDQNIPRESIIFVNKQEQ